MLGALLVTFLWSTSWVLIKIGLEGISPLVFAGLRYVLASALLVPIALSRYDMRAQWAALRGAWLRLAALGVVLYAITQGAQFVALERAPAVTVSLVLSLTPMLVALLSIPLLREPPASRQWVGVGLVLAGAWLYFGFAGVDATHWLGIAVAGVAMVANGAASLQGRAINRGARLPPLVVTAVSMGIGSVCLLATGLMVEGMPSIDGRGWLILGWLAVVNTAFAFTLWNQTLQRLTATESSVINNTMLVQIAILAWLFLGESLGIREIAGVGVVAVGALLVQLRR